MAPYIQPKTLFTVARETIGKHIVTECIAIERRFKSNVKEEATLTYDNADCAAFIQTFHDGLLSLVPPAMCNFICEAALTYHDNVHNYLRMSDRRILYSVVVNENVTSLRVRVKLGDEPGLVGIEHIIPRLKNIVTLDLGLVESDEIVLAVSKTCKKLENIFLHLNTSSETFRSLIHSCPQLKIIDKFSEESKENLLFAITSLPNLEILWCRGLAKAVRSVEESNGPLKLVSFRDESAIPRHVLAAVNLCPHLQDLHLCAGGDNKEARNSPEILDILTESNLNLKKLYLDNFMLCDESTEKFFFTKGKHIKDLSIKSSEVTDICNFVKFIAICCYNVQRLSLFDLDIIASDGEYPSIMFNIPAHKKPSFCHLQELNVEYGGNYSYVEMPDQGLQSEVLPCVMDLAPSLEKITVLNMQGEWKKEYPSDDRIEVMFPIERLTNLHHLSLEHFKITKRIVQYFLNNAPNLVHFAVLCDVSWRALTYIESMRQKYRKKNINMTFDVGGHLYHTEDYPDGSEDGTDHSGDETDDSGDETDVSEDYSDFPFEYIFLKTLKSQNLA